MKRFYCTAKRGQVTVESATTIIDSDDRVANFFEPTPKEYRKAYTVDGLPFNELIPPTPSLTIEENALAITAKATEIIEAKYSPLKQRKMLSTAVALMDKVNQGGVLTEYEQSLMQFNRDVNSWITAIRVVENTAIFDGTLLEEVNWEVV